MSALFERVPASLPCPPNVSQKSPSRNIEVGWERAQSPSAEPFSHRGGDVSCISRSHAPGPLSTPGTRPPARSELILVQYEDRHYSCLLTSARRPLAIPADMVESRCFYVWRRNRGGYLTSERERSIKGKIRTKWMRERAALGPMRSKACAWCLGFEAARGAGGASVRRRVGQRSRKMSSPSARGPPLLAPPNQPTKRSTTDTSSPRRRPRPTVPGFASPRRVGLKGPFQFHKIKNL